MPFVQDELIFNTPVVLEKLTEPTSRRLAFDVYYKEFDGEDAELSGLLLNELVLHVAKDDLIINEDARTIEFESLEEKYIVRPIQEDDVEHFNEEYLKEVQEGGR
jgi:hypothetical protein